MSTDAIGPTKERLAKSEHWDTPEIDAKTNRRAHKAVDDVTRAWRTGKLEFPHYQAWEKFNRHYEGALLHDVRVTDTTSVRSDNSDAMPPWQFHGEKIAEARADLVPRQFRILELLAEGWTFKRVGFQFGAYRSRQQSEAYALGVIEDALDRLALLWGLKQRQTTQIRG